MSQTVYALFVNHAPYHTHREDWRLLSVHRNRDDAAKAGSERTNLPDLGYGYKIENTVLED